MSASASDIATEERTLVITRIFDAPRELVFKLWSDPKHLIHWMGPREYPAMKVDNDFRVGGQWRIGLRAVDGREDLWQSGGLSRDRSAAGNWRSLSRGKAMWGVRRPNETFVTIELEDMGGRTAHDVQTVPLRHGEQSQRSQLRLEQLIRPLRPLSGGM